MAGVVSGGITVTSTLGVAVAASGNVLTAQNLPVSLTQSTSYAAGTGANQANKVATFGGSAAASPASIDLTTIVCLDGTTGFSHVREILVFNDDAANPLLWDFTATNALVAMFAAGGATAKITIQPSDHERKVKHLGTNGYVVDSTHKIISLDPAAATIAYRGVVVGD